MGVPQVSCVPDLPMNEKRLGGIILLLALFVFGGRAILTDGFALMTSATSIAVSAALALGVLGIALWCENRATHARGIRGSTMAPSDGAASIGTCRRCGHAAVPQSMVCSRCGRVLRDGLLLTIAGVVLATYVGVSFSRANMLTWETAAVMLVLFALGALLLKVGSSRS